MHESNEWGVYIERLNGSLQTASSRGIIPGSLASTSLYLAPPQNFSPTCFLLSTGYLLYLQFNALSGFLQPWYHIWLTFVSLLGLIILWPLPGNAHLVHPQPPAPSQILYHFVHKCTSSNRLQTPTHPSKIGSNCFFFQGQLIYHPEVKFVPQRPHNYL